MPGATGCWAPGTARNSRRASRASWKPIVAVYASIPLAVVAIIWLAVDGHLGTTPIWVLIVILVVTSVANLLSFLWLRAGPAPACRCR